jgi:hypothetical protein
MSLWLRRCLPFWPPLASWLMSGQRTSNKRR